MDTNPSWPLPAYTGKYISPLYGQAEVSLSGNTLLVNVNDVLLATVAHWNFNTFYGSYQKAWYGKALAQFSLNASGKIDGLVIGGMAFVKE